MKHSSTLNDRTIIMDWDHREQGLIREIDIHKYTAFQVQVFAWDLDAWCIYYCVPFGCWCMTWPLPACEASACGAPDKGWNASSIVWITPLGCPAFGLTGCASLILFNSCLEINESKLKPYELCVKIRIGWIVCYEISMYRIASKNKSYQQRSSSGKKNCETHFSAGSVVWMTKIKFRIELKDSSKFIF